jgi:hypothetical protein
MTRKKHKADNWFVDLFHIDSKELTKENLIESVVIRPFIQMTSFFTFIAGLFFLAIQNFKWAGSLIIFSFVLTVFSIYKSLTDEESIYRTLNLIFKLTLFLVEIIAFNLLLLKM